MNKYILLFGLITLISSCESQTKKTMTTYKYTNSLINETSPYLLQHAHNPVNWYAWNQKALNLAKKENKLLIISIGYSACHWCHVMEHESFENLEVAKVMNDHFISIKVDREERPDVDQIYMSAVQLMTGSGGWPLNVVALPDGRPIWGGTFFRRADWIRILNQLANLYQKDPEKLRAYAANLTKGVKQSGLITLNTSKDALKQSALDGAVAKWEQHFDEKMGGNKGAPKFPMPNNLDFLLQYASQTHNTKLLDYVNTSLTKMAYGGIYDQLGGGFARYSTDSRWHIPHFEKMLSDNGQMLSLYAKAYSATKNKLYKGVVYQTAAFLERDLLDKSGAFYSSLDADSRDKHGELKEGAYYSWDIPELKSLLGTEFDLFSDYYNVNAEGKWENDSYILIRTQSDVAFAKAHNLTTDNLETEVKHWKNILLKARQNRPKPRLDDKSLSSWNALTIKGYVDAYKAFGDPHFLNIALNDANFIMKNMLQPNGSLFRNYKNGKSNIDGYLIDYASVASAFIDLYQVTLDQKWLTQAKQLTDYCFVHFFDKTSQMFYFTSNASPSLVAKKIVIYDNVIPSSNSITALNLFKLYHYYSDTRYIDVATQMLRNVKDNALAYAAGASNWLTLYDYSVGKYYELAIVGKDALKLTADVNAKYLPNTLVAASTNSSTLPLLESRYVQGHTYIYVCVDRACKMPVQTVAEAMKLMK